MQPLNRQSCFIEINVGQHSPHLDCYFRFATTENVQMHCKKSININNSEKLLNNNFSKTGTE